MKDTGQCGRDVRKLTSTRLNFGKFEGENVQGSDVAAKLSVKLTTFGLANGI